MKAPLSKLIPELLRSYETARENLAVGLMRTDKVRSQIHEAAGKGHRALRIAMPDGVDLRDTESAEALKEWVKANGLQLEWLSRTATLEGGRQASGYDVEISW
ncbi:hypothetical protein ACVWZM_005226 [Bradyrhizobium sp. USDA 4501]